MVRETGLTGTLPLWGVTPGHFLGRPESPPRPLFRPPLPVLEFVRVSTCVVGRRGTSDRRGGIRWVPPSRGKSRFDLVHTGWHLRTPGGGRGRDGSQPRLPGRGGDVGWDGGGLVDRLRGGVTVTGSRGGRRRSDRGPRYVVSLSLASSLPVSVRVG